MSGRLRPIDGTAPIALAAVAGAVLAGLALRTVLPEATLLLLFTVAVLVAAVLSGVMAGLFAAILGFLAFNFVFVEPRFTLVVAEGRDMLALALLLFAGLLTGSLAGRLKEEAEAARRRAAVLEALAAFSNRLGRAGGPDDVMAAMADTLAGSLEGSALVLARRGQGLTTVASVPAAIRPDPEDEAAAERVIRLGAEAPRPAAGWPGARFEFRPFEAGSERLAVGFAGPAGRPLAEEGSRVAAAVLAQAAGTLDRLHSEAAAAEARATAERERFRAALVSSISHDLRTPLASILGAVTSLRELGDLMPPQARDELLEAIEAETRRLARFVANLLDMTRIEAGLEPRREPVDLADLAASVVHRARRSFPGGDFRLILPPSGVPLVAADPALLEQVLFNLIENAVKFSPPAAPIAVELAARPEGVEMAVADRGPGIPAADRERVFEPFRVSPGTAGSGTGLGLAVCRGIVTALGGTILAGEAPGGGARLSVTLPVEGAAP